MIAPSSRELSALAIPATVPVANAGVPNAAEGAFKVELREMDGIVPYDQRSLLIAKLRIEFEFLAVTPVAGSANYHSVIIDWMRPRFRITQIPGEPSLSPIPAFPGRLGDKVIHLNRWYRSISIQY